MSKTAALRSGTDWPVRPSRGGLVGFAVGAALVAAGASCLIVAIGRPLSLPVVALVLLGGVAIGLGCAAVVLALGYFRLRYELADGELRVHWAGPMVRVRLDEIDGIYGGQQIGPLRRIRGLTWPGYFVGTARSRSHGPLRLYCTDLASESLSIVVAAHRTLVLSPNDPPAFRRELIRRIEAGESEPSSAAPDGRGARGLPQPVLTAFTGAALAWLIGCAAAVVLGFQTLPEMIGRFPAGPGAGPPLESREWLVSLPLLGAVVLALNLAIGFALRRREPGAGVLLAGSASLVALLVLLSSLRVLA